MKDFIANLRPRKCHIYCLGAAKTGTTSLAQMMSQQRRAAHEPETAETNRLIIQFLQNRLSKDEITEQLKKRDKRLNLEFESSHPLGYVAELLPDLYSKAKFIVTYRDPKAWLRSRVNYHHGKDPDEWRDYRKCIWERHFNGYSAQEAALEKAGLFSLEAYLKQYLEQYEVLLKHLPANRTILIKTEDISTSTDTLRQFCTGKSSLKELDAVVTNKFKPSHSVLDELSPEYIDEQLQLLNINGELSQRLMSKFA